MDAKMESTSGTKNLCCGEKNLVFEKKTTNCQALGSLGSGSFFIVS
jgi:hypothetical protein